jgi:hypothetical protein
MNITRKVLSIFLFSIVLLILCVGVNATLYHEFIQSGNANCPSAKINPGNDGACLHDKQQNTNSYKACTTSILDVCFGPEVCLVTFYNYVGYNKGTANCRRCRYYGEDYGKANCRYITDGDTCHWRNDICTSNGWDCEGTMENLLQCGHTVDTGEGISECEVEACQVSGEMTFCLNYPATCYCTNDGFKFLASAPSSTPECCEDSDCSVAGHLVGSSGCDQNSCIGFCNSGQCSVKRSLMYTDCGTDSDCAQYAGFEHEITCYQNEDFPEKVTEPGACDTTEGAICRSNGDKSSKDLCFPEEFTHYYGSGQVNIAFCPIDQDHDGSIADCDGDCFRYDCVQAGNDIEQCGFDVDNDGDVDLCQDNGKWIDCTADWHCQDNEMCSNNDCVPETCTDKYDCNDANFCVEGLCKEHCDVLASSDTNGARCSDNYYSYTHPYSGMCSIGELDSNIDHCDKEEVAVGSIGKYMADCYTRNHAGDELRLCDNDAHPGFSPTGICSVTVSRAVLPSSYTQINCDPNEVCEDDLGIYRNDCSLCVNGDSCDKDVNPNDYLSASSLNADGICCGSGCVGSASSNCCSNDDCGAYACASNTCKTTCSSNSDCNTNHFCLSGECISKLTNGEICTTDSDCISNQCDPDFFETKRCHTQSKCIYDASGNEFSNGYEKCYNDEYYKSCASGVWSSQTSCALIIENDGCRTKYGSCNSNYAGGCTPPSLNTASGTICSNDPFCMYGLVYTGKACNGGGFCNVKIGGTGCPPATCGITSGNVYEAKTQSTCSGGACTSQIKIPCDAYTCDGNVCRTSCTQDNHCITDNNCIDNECSPCTATETSCEDGLDNDCDGDVDIVDSDCAGCSTSTPPGYSVLTISKTGLCPGHYLAANNCYYSYTGCKDTDTRRCYYDDIHYLYQNGFHTASPLNTFVSDMCYPGQGACTDSAASSATGVAIRGNGYVDGDTCYYGDMTCEPNNAQSGDTCTMTSNTICGDGSAYACKDCSPYVRLSTAECRDSCDNDDHCVENSKCIDNECIPCIANEGSLCNDGVDNDCDGETDFDDDDCKINNGYACESDVDCKSDNCVLAINENNRYCARDDKDCSLNYANYAGFATGVDYLRYICKGHDLGGSFCDTPTYCDTWGGQFCHINGYWQLGDGTLYSCQSQDTCIGNSRFNYLKCNGLPGEQGACDLPGGYAYGCSTEYSTNSYYCAEDEWVQAGANNCCEKSSSGVGLISDPCAGIDEECINNNPSRSCYNGADVCNINIGASCNSGSGVCLADGTCTDCIDNDGDDYSTSGGECGAIDCDDNNPNVYPGAQESCNDVDEDCDGYIDAKKMPPVGFGPFYLYYCDCTEDNPIEQNSPTINPHDTVSLIHIPSVTHYKDVFGVSKQKADVCTSPTAILEAACKNEPYFDDGTPGYGTGIPTSSEPLGLYNSCPLGCVTTDEIAYCEYDLDDDGYCNSALAASSSLTTDYERCLLCTPNEDPDCENGEYGTPVYDCDDDNLNTNPGATEICSNGIDDNCNDQVDEDCLSCTDIDDDGYSIEGGDCGTIDCDDNDPTVNEVCCGDNDGDGFLDATCGGDDCDDGNINIMPGAEEICNEVDDNCNGVIDTDAVDKYTFYLDNDEDNYGVGTTTTEACFAPDGYTENLGDCNDQNAEIHPEAIETCNNLDDDCDGEIDDGMPFTIYYPDLDHDGYGVGTTTTEACELPADHSTNSEDCNDNNNLVYPGALETCNSLDDNCDGQVDEGLTNACGGCGDTPEEACGGGDEDCDGLFDEIGSIEYALRNACNKCESVPDEVCDNDDNDCDGEIDENLPLLDCYLDSDNDGYGSTLTQVCYDSCDVGYVTQDGDCDDSDAEISPSDSEICDGLDNDCDDDIDENLATTTCYTDSDGDGYGNINTAQSSCAGACDVGQVTLAGDCDDSNAQINPDAAEVCDGIDNNCKNGIDDADFEMQMELCSNQLGECQGEEKTCLGAQGWEECTGFIASEAICDDGLDNDCDGTLDYEGHDTTPNDEDCVVSLSEIIVSDDNPCPDIDIDVSCVANAENLASIKVSGLDCSFTGWVYVSGKYNKEFKCNSGDAGTKAVACYIDPDIAEKAPGTYVKTLTVGGGDCCSLNPLGNCANDPGCVVCDLCEGDDSFRSRIGATEQACTSISSCTGGFTCKENVCGAECTESETKTETCNNYCIDEFTLASMVSDDVVTCSGYCTWPEATCNDNFNSIGCGQTTHTFNEKNMMCNCLNTCSESENSASCNLDCDIDYTIDCSCFDGYFDSNNNYEDGCDCQKTHDPVAFDMGYTNYEDLACSQELPDCGLGDGVDNDCNGQIDETVLDDYDGDGSPDVSDCWPTDNTKGDYEFYQLGGPNDAYYIDLGDMHKYCYEIDDSWDMITNTEELWEYCVTDSSDPNYGMFVEQYHCVKECHDGIYDCDSCINPIIDVTLNDEDNDGVVDVCDVENDLESCTDGLDNNADGVCDVAGCVIDGVEHPADPACDDMCNSCEECGTGFWNKCEDAECSYCGSKCNYVGTIFGECITDSDEDEIADDVDNCKNTENFDQLDQDEDGLGDACDDCPTNDLIPLDYNLSTTEFGKCTDGVDNDCNGVADCDDEICENAVACGGMGECTPDGDNAVSSNKKQLCNEGTIYTCSENACEQHEVECNNEYQICQGQNVPELVYFCNSIEGEWQIATDGESPCQSKEECAGETIWLDDPDTSISTWKSACVINKTGMDRDNSLEYCTNQGINIGKCEDLYDTYCWIDGSSHPNAPCCGDDESETWYITDQDNPRGCVDAEYINDADYAEGVCMIISAGGGLWANPCNNMGDTGCWRDDTSFGNYKKCCGDDGNKDTWHDGETDIITLLTSGMPSTCVQGNWFVADTGEDLVNYISLTRED